MANVIAKELLMKDREPMRFKDGTDLRHHMRIVEQGMNGTVVEFIGTDNFNKAWYERQRYEVDRGRDQEPLLYQSIYEITTDPTLPRNVPVYRLGPAGVVFHQIEEGGEVRFATVGQSNFSVPIYQYAMGLRYSKSLVMFNELWSVAEVEVQAGTAYNALLNHIHFNPILTHTYASGNKTDGTALTDFNVADPLPLKYANTLEAAVAAAASDKKNPRRGPYDLLVASANAFTWEKALRGVPQQGTSEQSSIINRIRNIIVYDGWTGDQGAKTVTYDGVTAGKAYLVDLSLRNRHFRSYVKQDLQSTMGNPDVSRFILEETVWDAWFGTYADPTGAVHEITTPTAASGAS